MLSCDVLKSNDGRMTTSYIEVRERIYDFLNLLNATPQLLLISSSYRGRGKKNMQVGG